MKPNNSYKGFVGTDDSFNLHLDLEGNGELLKLLVSPSEVDYIITMESIHLCTLKHYCEAWHISDGNISEETAQKIGDAIEDYYK